MSYKIEISPTLDNLTNDDYKVVFELSLLKSNIKKGSVWCVGFFPFILKNI